MPEYTERYLLKASWQNEWQIVTKEAYCRAERNAGFRPKLSSDDPNYMTTPATSSFSSGDVLGRIEYSIKGP